MLKSFYTTQFKRDYKLQQKRHKDLDLLDDLIRILVKEEPLPPKNRDHPLQGDYKGYRECHIEPDWLLICKVEGDSIYFVRTGTHSDLFK
ncbi:MAG: type II toxin-antitoxin system YafQ family toxin [Candidatus Omnitrophica bacterium]|nr:type II toxin-antitoxin system YafQ family toxin [Candidatus Omnitrophota bacterium]